LSDNDNIFNEAHYVASNIPIFVLKNVEFVCSVDKYQLSQGFRNDFWTTRRQKKYKIIKFRFVPKLPSI